MKDVKVDIGTGKEFCGVRVVQDFCVPHISQEFARIFIYEDYISTSGLVAPSNQPTSLTFTSVTSSSYTVSWTASVGGADGYVVFRRTGASPTYTPVDGTTYVVDTVYGDSTCEYFGSAVTFNESGLSQLTTYYYDVFAYNGTTGTYKFLTTSPLEGSQQTLFNFANCLRFDTVNDIVTHSVNNFLGGRNKFTWAGWVIFDESLAVGHNLWVESPGTNFRARLYYQAAGNWRLDVQNGGNTFRNFTWTPTSGVKYHIGIKYDGTVTGTERARMLVDGSYLTQDANNPATQVGTTGVPIQYNTSLAFRANNWAWWSDEDVTHITNHYNGGAGAEPDATNLIKYNKFNGSNPSTVLVDETGTDNGTLVNFNFDASSGWEAWP